MVMVLEREMIEQIAQLGRYRAPNEACGLLLPFPINGKQIIEIPNRSKKPRDSFTMLGTDMIMALEQLVPDLTVLEKLLEGLTAWHTHPGGNLGPSREDMRQKPEKLNSLVVTLYTDGRLPQATWY